MSESWHLQERDVLMIEASLCTVISPPAILGAASLPTPCIPPLLDEVSDFALAPLLFREALAAGWPWVLVMLLLSGLQSGRSCDCCIRFILERCKQK